MAIRFGTVPILWNNDDVPELTTPATPYERVLDEIKEAGFVGTELGSNYPKDAHELKAALDARGLTTQPMPAGDIALDGVHWFIEGAATLGALGLDVSRVETAIFVDGFD